MEYDDDEYDDSYDYGCPSSGRDREDELRDLEELEKTMNSVHLQYENIVINVCVIFEDGFVVRHSYNNFNCNNIHNYSKIIEQDLYERLYDIHNVKSINLFDDNEFVYQETLYKTVHAKVEYYKK